MDAVKVIILLLLNSNIAIQKYVTTRLKNPQFFKGFNSFFRLAERVPILNKNVVATATTLCPYTFGNYNSQKGKKKKKNNRQTCFTKTTDNISAVLIVF